MWIAHLNMMLYSKIFEKFFFYRSVMQIFLGKFTYIVGNNNKIGQDDLIFIFLKSMGYSKNELWES